jgi:hypothetical protein
MDRKRMSETLGQMQERFAVMLSMLIVEITAKGYKVRLRDLYRDERTNGKWGVKMGYGAANSVHKLGIAIDAPLFKDDKPCPEKDYEQFHDYWMSIGGAIAVPSDANHFSLEYHGYR